VELVGLEEVFKQSDFLTVNCLLNDETRHIVNAERLALMKKTAYVINTARGPVIDEHVILSPHALCFTDQCLAGLGDADVKACLDVMKGKAPESVVNQEVLKTPGFKAKLNALASRFA